MTLLAFPAAFGNDDELNQHNAQRTQKKSYSTPKKTRKWVAEYIIKNTGALVNLVNLEADTFEEAKFKAWSDYHHHAEYMFIDVWEDKPPEAPTELSERRTQRIDKKGIKRL